MPSEEKFDPKIVEKLKKEIKEEAHKEYSTFIGFLGVLFRTVNPRSYKKLTSTSVKQGLRFYFHVLFFSFLLFILLTIPYLFSFYEKIRTEANNLETFTLTPQLSVNQVIVFKDFNIVVANNKTYDSENLLVTQQSIYWKNGLCIFSSLACLLNNDPHSIDFSGAHALAEDRDKFTNLSFGLIILMLPGILLLLFLYHFVKFFLIIIIFFCIGLIYTTAIRYEIHAQKLFLIALYSLTLTTVVETVFSIYYNTYYISYIFSFILFVLTTYIVAEKPFHHFKH